MAIRMTFPWNMATFPPGGTSNTTAMFGLVTMTYTRKLTYGQINGIKGVLKLMKKLKVSKKLIDVTFNQTETTMGSPGMDTYRVRIRYKNDKD